MATDGTERQRLLSVVATDGSPPKFGTTTTLFEVEENALAGGFEVTPDGFV